jgi:hypothetical protein
VTVTLATKLGALPGQRVVVLGVHLDLGGVEPYGRLVRDADVIVFVTGRRAELARRLPALQDALTTAGGLWIGWPKRASGVATDLDEHVVRALLLPTSFVDNKVCAIDETWTAMRYVLRRELRR